jgi:hypothetical protein
MAHRQVADAGEQETLVQAEALGERRNGHLRAERFRLGQ